MVEQRRGEEKSRGVQGPFLCVSRVHSLNCGTQLLILGRSPCPWHQATGCLNQDIPSTLPNTVSSSSAHSCAHPILAPLCIVLLLPRGQVVDGHNWDRGTPFPYKGLEGLHETRRVSSTVRGLSADS